MTAPTTRTTSLEQALDHIAAEPAVWVRMAAVRNEDGAFKSLLVELTSGGAPPSWEQKVWEYPTALFIAQVLSGSEAATCLRSATIQLGSHEIALPEMMGMVTWERRQSRSPAPYESLDWPVTETSLSLNMGGNAEPQGHLVAEGDAPSFLSFYTAAASFFWLNRQPVGGSLQQGVMYRHQDLGARINAVRIADDAVEIDVEGDDLDGVVVELPGDAPGPSDSIWRPRGNEPQTVRFPLKDGLPVGTWTLVRRGPQWLDRRFLSVPYARGNEAGVEIVVDAGTRLEALVASRERQQVEFKLQLPKDDETKSKIMKTICAFANGQGGSLLIGVDDDRNLVGLEEGSVDRLRDRLTQTISSWVEPWPDGTFNVLPIADSNKVVLELWVNQGRALHGCGRPGEVRTAYVRHHGTTEKATLAEITALVQSRTPGALLSPFAYR
jgi:hypothetical protein